ncbi:uncharacterized protein LOC134230001 isoform X2 [Saccostrea cucullata]|uniref:uncharacterized protein LOC134230001 isoform X2 n=1 Tax=Saccostrea cuccullata TaxID=36930 RepID=UPI002ECFF231
MSRNHLILGSMLYLISLGFAFSTPSTYYECEVYPGNANVDQTRRECMRETVDNEELLYCKSWQCETPNTCTEEERLTASDGCQFCPETCSIYGKIYKVGEGTKCIDNINSCNCFATGSVSTTYVGYNKELLCNAVL